MLSPYRVLDLTDEKGLFCARILGDLGADVILVEPPVGNTARKIGPFYHDQPDLEKSLYWFAYNTNKRSVTLNLRTSRGIEIFKELLKTADFVIESFPPGYMNELGLGFSTLQEINKAIIMTSITHFGQTGPYKNYESCDLVDMAMSGYMYLAGDIDRPPVRIGFPQAYLYGGLEASAGTLIAFHHRCLTGEGQWVDVAIRDSLIKLCHVSRPWWDMNRVILKRMGPLRAGLSNALVQREMWPCKEGTINFYITGGLGGARSNRALVQWMDEEGVADDFLRNIDWDNFDVAAMNQETQDELEKRFSKFFAGHRSDELYEGAKKRRILLHPVTYIKDLAENQQLQARSFWEEVNHPELGESIIYPGMWVKCPEQPLKIRKRPPLIGEHNQEVYSEIGLQERDLVALKENNVI